MKLDLRILAQPDDVTCGPTCLHAVYDFFDLGQSLDSVIEEVPALPEGGTLAGMLGCHALSRGLSATVHTCNLRLFDPTWFEGGVDLAAKLRAQAEQKADPKLAIATDTYVRFLSLGGEIRFARDHAGLIRELLGAGRPVLAGLSATYLYGCARERDDDFDDVGGEASGHFVLLGGHDPQTDRVRVMDPLADNPLAEDHEYEVDVHHLVAALLLGVLTWDAVLLVVEPRAVP